MKNENVKKGIIFPLGKENVAYAKDFIGKSYLEPLVNDPKANVSVSNVTFEPGCRNNWHKHHNGFQILLVTGGEGWYQEAGKPARLLKPGDVVVTHNDVKHWHGATKNSWFSHIAITAGKAIWLEPVTDKQYEEVAKGANK